MADPRQLCYLCDRPIDEIGKAGEEHPGVCWECDQKENPEIQAKLAQERRLRGIQEQPTQNPLLRKPGMPRPAKSPLQKHFDHNPQIPQSPYSPPPRELPAGDDGDAPNPLNG